MAQGLEPRPSSPVCARRGHASNPSHRACRRHPARSIRRFASSATNLRASRGQASPRSIWPIALAMPLRRIAEAEAGCEPGAVGRRHAGIDGHMQKGLADVLPARPGIGGGAYMHRHLLVMAERRQQSQGDDGALASGPARPRPHRAPGGFGDQLLERAVEIGGSGLGLVNMGVAETPRRTAGPSS